MELSELRLEHFEPLVSQVFRLALPGSKDWYRFELVDVRASRFRDSKRSQRKPFSLLFKGPGEFAFPQATYQVEHDTLGKLEFLLVPVIVEEEGRFLEAVFT